MRDIDWQIISTLYLEKNITKTAELLFMTQPTLTKRIQQIEAELGMILITRSTKGVNFTPEGVYIAKKAKEVLSVFEEVREFAAEAGGSKGVLKLGVPNSYARFALPSLIKRFSKEHGNIRLDISTALSDEVLRLVENREVHLGFVRGSFPTKLQKHLVSVDQIYAVCKGEFRLEDLPILPQIDYIKEPTIIKATDLWWKQYFDTPPNIYMRVNHGDTCREMIAQGLGYGIFPDANFTKDSKELTSMALYNKDGSRFTRKTWLVYHEKDRKNPIIRDFVEFVKSDMQ